ncbi:MAG: ATP-binding protein [Anaerolineae bacterium]|nr:ATP-binding protein [Anaerolineae bacterium]
MNNKHVSPAYSPTIFNNRDKEIWIVLGRVATNRESTVVYGEAGTGKTWLLKHLAAPSTLAEYELEDAIPIYIDCQTISITHFWHDIFAQLPSMFGENQPLIDELRAEESIDFSAARRILLKLMRNQDCLVLLLDNFDALIVQENSEEPDFLNQLRSLLISRDISIAAVLSLQNKLETLLQGFNFVGSEFNIFYPIELKPLDEHKRDS